MPRHSLATPKERTFVRHFLKTGHGPSAAQLAGYSSPSKNAAAILGQSKIKAILEAARENVLAKYAENASQVAEIHIARLTAKKTTNREFGSLLVGFHKALGLVGRNESDADAKEPSDMSQPELVAATQRMLRELGERADEVETIDLEPNVSRETFDLEPNVSRETFSSEADEADDIFA